MLWVFLAAPAAQQVTNSVYQSVCLSTTKEYQCITNECMQGCKEDQYNKNLDRNMDTGVEPTQIQTQNFEKSSSVCNERKCMVKKYLLNRSIRTFIKAKNNRNSKGFIRKICTKCHNVQCIKWCPSDLMYQSIIMQFLKKIVNNYSLFLFCYLSVEIEIYQNRY